MIEFIKEGTWFFSLLVGFIFFFLLASGFNNRALNQVRDKTVSILAVFISIICGLVVAVFTYVLATIFIH